MIYRAKVKGIEEAKIIDSQFVSSLLLEGVTCATLIDFAVINKADNEYHLYFDGNGNYDVTPEVTVTHDNVRKGNVGVLESNYDVDIEVNSIGALDAMITPKVSNIEPTKEEKAADTKVEEAEVIENTEEKPEEKVEDGVAMSESEAAKLKETKVTKVVANGLKVDLLAMYNEKASISGIVYTNSLEEAMARMEAGLPTTYVPSNLNDNPATQVFTFVDNALAREDLTSSVAAELVQDVLDTAGLIIPESNPILTFKLAKAILRLFDVGYTFEDIAKAIENVGEGEGKIDLGAYNELVVQINTLVGTGNGYLIKQLGLEGKFTTHMMHPMDKPLVYGRREEVTVPGAFVPAETGETEIVVKPKSTDNINIDLAKDGVKKEEKKESDELFTADDIREIMGTVDEADGKSDAELVDGKPADAMEVSGNEAGTELEINLPADLMENIDKDGHPATDPIAGDVGVELVSDNGELLSAATDTEDDTEIIFDNSESKML